PALMAEVFKTAPGALGKQVNPGRNSYCFIVTEEKESYLPGFAEVEAAATAACRQAEARLYVQNLKVKLESMLAEGQALVDCAKALGVEVQDSGFFGRGRGAIPKIGTDPQLSLQLFALADEAISPVLVFQDTIFCAQMRERRLEPGAQAEAERSQVTEQLRQYKAYRLMNEYVIGLRQAADIKVMAGVLD
ncbi:MAG: hypothetical protein JXR89_01820, partial [Deltaproteobacteria bacterium]|nr:hypothetical protein [Deltaproteobacteria bacterium]